MKKLILLFLLGTSLSNAQDIMVTAFHQGGKIVAHVQTEKETINYFFKKKKVKNVTYIAMINWFRNNGYELMYEPRISGNMSDYMLFWFKKIN